MAGKLFMIWVTAKNLKLVYVKPVFFLNPLKIQCKQGQYGKTIGNLKRIIEAIKVCSQQGFPQKGYHDDTTDPFSTDKNFQAVLKNLGKIDPNFKIHFQHGPKNILEEIKRNHELMCRIFFDVFKSFADNVQQPSL